MNSGYEKITYNLLAAGAAILAAKLVRAGLEKTWEAVNKEVAPENPADPETSWKEALIWSVASGVAVGLARMFAQRGAAAGWHRLMGYNPTRLK